MPVPAPRSVFTLQQARALLPQVRELTSEAVRRAESVASQLDRLPEDDHGRASLTDVLRAIVNGWAEQVRALGVEAKGLWLVDFDNGEGYYCWRYPEETVAHYHSYDAGFAGRMTIQ